MKNGTDRIQRARVEADAARRQLASSLGALQHRLRPGTLMSHAWDGVREKGSAVADGAVEAVKSRPLAVSGVIAAAALFFAREPIRALIADLFNKGSGHPDQDRQAQEVDRAAAADIHAPPPPAPERAVRRTRVEGVNA